MGFDISIDNKYLHLVVDWVTMELFLIDVDPSICAGTVVPPFEGIAGVPTLDTDTLDPSLAPGGVELALGTDNVDL